MRLIAITNQEFLMHELSVSKGLVDTVLTEAAKLNAAKVITATVAIGKCSCVMPEILTDYYHLLTEDTIAADSELVINRPKGEITCRSCGEVSEIPDFRLVCPKCGSRQVLLTKGRECYLESLEIES